MGHKWSKYSHNGTTSWHEEHVCAGWRGSWRVVSGKVRRTAVSVSFTSGRGAAFNYLVTSSQ